ncbi:MAG: hypothetical protein HUU56_17845 [Bdellovibrionaceae bacterium]|nr:hypothetical protein [Pseudobdellovibrionaceae bacterium]
MYYFKSKDKFLQIQTSPDQRKIVSSYVTNELINQEASTLRTGVFDNQGSSQAWTWAWTTDEGHFEVWRPTGLYLSLDSEGLLKVFRFREIIFQTPASLQIGKTGVISYGIVAIYSNGTRVSLLKDTYPFLDALFNVTYDGICEDENFYPLIMIGRELALRLKIEIDETICS